MAAVRDGCKGNFFGTSRRRPAPAFSGVPAAPDAFDAGAEPAGDRAPILVKAENIRPRMHVYDFNGVHVGQVKDVLDGMLVVGRPWHPDVQVPLEQVLAVLDQRVVLTVSRAGALRSRIRTAGLKREG